MRAIAGSTLEKHGAGFSRASAQTDGRNTAAPDYSKHGISRPLTSAASTDALPSKSSQQDQSPPGSTPYYAEDASPPPKTLDQRCRAFLSKMAAAHASPGPTPPTSGLLTSSRLVYPQPAAAPAPAADAEEACRRPQQRSWDARFSSQLRRPPAGRAGSSQGSGTDDSSSEYSTDEDSEDLDEHTEHGGALHMPQRAVENPRALPSNKTHGNISSGSHKSLYGEWNSLQQHQQLQQAKQSSSVLNSSSSNSSSSSEGWRGVRAHTDDQRMQPLQLGGASTAAAAAPLATLPAAADKAVFVKDISKGRFHNDPNSSSSSSGYGAGGQDKGDYLTKLSLSIHPSARSGSDADAQAPGYYPSLLLSPTQDQEGKRPSAGARRSSTNAAAAAEGAGFKAGGQARGESDVLEIPDWALRAYGLPDGYRAVGVHAPPEPVPSSLPADALRQRHQDPEQQQLEQRYMSAAAAVDAALVGKDAANSSSSVSNNPAGAAMLSEGASGYGARPGAIPNRPLGLRIPTEASQSSMVMGLSPKPYSPLGGHPLGGMGLDGGQHESIISSSSAERGIGGHCTMR